MKILILSCGTGEGHNSAARAVEEHLLKRNIRCEIKDVISFKSESAKKKVSAAYSAVITKAPALFGTAYVLGGLYDRMKLPSPVYCANAKYAGELYGYIQSNGFNCVICTHLFAMEAMTAVRKKFNCGVSVYGILTDYTAIPFYKDCLLDGWFVPNTKAELQLIKRGIPESLIYRTGIPVSEKFRSEITKSGAREALKLPQDKKIIAVTAGAAGCGKIIKLCKKLDKELDCNCLVAAFPARNVKLKERLLKNFGKNAKFLIVDFTQDIHLYFKAADVVLTKPGGLSSTEAAVANVPVIHLKAIPGCETANVKYFSRNGLSVKAQSVKKAVKAVKKLLADEDCTRNMLDLQRIFINSYAVDAIIEKITEDADNGSVAVDGVYFGRLSCGRDNVLQICPEADNG